MAKQVGIVKITGTIDDITFYEMGGEYYARMKSSLTGKRFWKDKAFEGSRKSAKALGVASKLASLLYRTLPKEEKGRPVFQKLTGKIKFMVLEGRDAEAITMWFQKEYKTRLMVEQIAESETVNKGKQPKAYTPPVAAYDHPVVVTMMREVNNELKLFQQEFTNAHGRGSIKLRKRKRCDETVIANFNSS